MLDFQRNLVFGRVTEITAANTCGSQR